MTRGARSAPETVEAALRLREEGLSLVAIARLLGLSRGTIAGWCAGRVPRTPWVERCPKCAGHQHSDVDGVEYAYLLGLYLGDGCLSTPGRQVWLSIAMDSAYPGIVAECRQAISAVLPHRRSNTRQVPGKNLILIRSYGPEWLCLFPQHGPGKKHRRRIELVDWQEQIVYEHPGRLLRGLIHSDGWRGLNRVHVKGKDYSYSRYQFSSRSSDIRRIFTDTCDLLGIEWRRWGKWHVSVARRESVAKLDQFVGPKY